LRKVRESSRDRKRRITHNLREAYILSTLVSSNLPFYLLWKQAF